MDQIRQKLPIRLAIAIFYLISRISPIFLFTKILQKFYKNILLFKLSFLVLRND